MIPEALLDIFRSVEALITSLSPEVLLEIFGYVGTMLIVLSMMMTSVTKLRIVNMTGSVISAIYGGLCGTWPVVVTNVCLFLINGFQLIKSKKNKAE